MRKKLRDISINTKIFITFIFILLATSVFTSYFPYLNWFDLIDQTTEKTINTLSNEIINEVDIFLKDAKYLNEINKGLLESGTIDIENEAIRESFFINALSTFDNGGIYSFSYGTEAGEYYGARKNKDDIIEIMKNNKETYGNSWYYSVENGRSKDHLLDAGKFDPRIREWYQVAKGAEKPVFSPIYKHFVLDDLAISSSIPIHDEAGNLKGVLGSHINLSRFDNYLKDIVSDKNACAMIVEKKSGNIIASCQRRPYFIKRENGDIGRLSINEINDKAMFTAYKEYLENGIDTYNINDENGDVHIKVMGYEDDGLEWLVLTLLPESLMVSTINTSIKVGLLLNVLMILVSSYLFFRAMKIYTDPISSLIQTQEEFAKGDLLKREKITRNDEIGMLACSFNTMADMIYSLINNLEKQVKKRTEELRESKDYFETTLLSVGDGIIATDGQGLITVMNPVVEEITGWSNKKAHGKQFLEVVTIIYENTDKTYKNPIDKVLKYGEIVETCGNPILVSKDNEEISIEYTAAPIKNKHGDIVGTVIILRDITDKKEKLDEIKYLSMYDQLTGLYNRWYMEDETIRLDKKENLPLTLMVVDVNGLKLVNDAFGHDTGDRLLKNVSKALKNALRAEDVIGRVGGDEFLILLPKVNANEAEKVKQRILKAISSEKLDSVIISVAIGYTVKESMDKDIENIRTSADNQMYKNKLIHGKTMRNQTIETVIRNINFKYDQEQIHTERVSQYCESIARAMGFSEERVKDIKIAGVLHDIGKIVVPPELLNKSERLTDEEFQLIKRHPETGYHILKSVDEYMELAEDVLCHHENWDGSGYPQGLKGYEIPINARIISVADAFEAMTAQRPYQKTKTKEEAILELQRCAGSQFDPEIVKIFIEEVLE